MVIGRFPALRNLIALYRLFQLRMAALNEPFYGNLQGMRNADLNCHRQARRAGLMGTFRAFLSARFVSSIVMTKVLEITKLLHRIQNLDSIVKPEDRDLPITNLRGDVLFNSWNSIFSAQGGFFSQAPRIYSFSGKNILSDPTWWVYEFLKGKFRSGIWQWLPQTVKRSLTGVENIYQLFCYLRLQWIFATECCFAVLEKARVWEGRVRYLSNKEVRANYVR